MKWILPLVVLAGLAGCLSPDVPDDAVVVEDDELPGLRLTAWTEDAGDRTRMHGIIENVGDTSYDIRVGCGHPWNSTIISPDGDEVHFREVLEEPGCAAFWDVLAPGGDMEVQYSWDGRHHDPEAGSAEELSDGVYLWSLKFMLRGTDAYLEAVNPIILGDRALDDFTMTLDAHGEYSVDVTVRNDGDAEPAFWTGCMTEWSWRILSEGQEVPLEPMATCQGFSETTFPPGHEVNATFTWGGMRWDADTETASPAPAGVYTWEVTFGLEGTGGDVIVGTAQFEVA